MNVVNAFDPSQAQIQRHKNYTLHMNCQMDSKKPIDASAVAAEVQRMERQRERAESGLMQFTQAQTKNKSAESSNAVYSNLIQQVTLAL